MTKVMPVVSVIIPTYNRANHIERSLKSVLSFEHRLDFEVIVVDDGSTDDTLQVVRNKFGDKVKLLALEHTGKPACVRNAGLEIAQGEFIAFQDSDDVWVNRNLAKEIEVFNNPKVVLTYANAQYIDAGGKPTKDGLLVKQKETMSGYAFIRKASKRPAPVPTPTVIIRKNVMDKIGMFNKNLIVGTDTDYWLRISTIGDFHFTNEVRALIRRDGTNISSMPSEDGDRALYKHELSRIDMFSQILKEIPLNDIEEKILRYRIAELHFYVTEISKRLGVQPPFDIKSITLPRKPKELQDIDDLYEKTVVGRIDKILRVSLGRWPKLHHRTRTIVKALISPFRSKT